MSYRIHSQTDRKRDAAFESGRDQNVHMECVCLGQTGKAWEKLPRPGGLIDCTTRATAEPRSGPLPRVGASGTGRVEVREPASAAREPTEQRPSPEPWPRASCSCPSTASCRR